MAINPNYLDCSVIFNCLCCNKEISIRVHEGDYMAYYRDSDSAEDAFPYLSEKEQAMISMQLCEDCLDKYDDTRDNSMFDTFLK